MEYKNCDLIELLEDKRILHDTYLKKGTLVYINEIDSNSFNLDGIEIDNTLLNVSEIDSDYDYWITAGNTRLIERGENESIQIYR